MSGRERSLIKFTLIAGKGQEKGRGGQRRGAELNGEIKVRTGGYVGNGTGMRTIQSDITVYNGFVNWSNAIWGIFGGDRSFSVPAEANINGTQYHYVVFGQP